MFSGITMEVIINPWAETSLKRSRNSTPEMSMRVWGTKKSKKAYNWSEVPLALHCRSHNYIENSSWFKKFHDASRSWDCRCNTIGVYLFLFSYQFQNSPPKKKNAETRTDVELHLPKASDIPKMQKYKMPTCSNTTSLRNRHAKAWRPWIPKHKFDWSLNYQN